MNAVPTVGDRRSLYLSERLQRAAKEVTEPQCSRIVHMLPQTVFVSHTSADDRFIKGTEVEKNPPVLGSILWLIGSKFPEPFYHSRKTGAGQEYERTVGLALLSSTRVVIVWSENALRSDYVRAEILIATQGQRKLGVYVMRGAPPFPISAWSWSTILRAWAACWIPGKKLRVDLVETLRRRPSLRSSLIAD
jgi:hypothetical protein